MSNIAKFIEENPQAVALVKKIIQMYEDDRLTYHNDHCGICYKKLNSEDFAGISHMHFWRTCVVHRPYAFHYQLPLELQEEHIRFSKQIFPANY